MVLINSIVAAICLFMLSTCFPPRIQQASPLFRNGVAQPDDRDIYILNTMLNNIKHLIEIFILTLPLLRNGVAQPDDREHRQGGDEEACMAVLNDFYGDGLYFDEHMYSYFDIF